MIDPLFVSRDEIADQAALIVDYAVMMGDFARVGHDHGVAYTYRKTLAHMRAAVAPPCGRPPGPSARALGWSPA